MAVDEIGPVPPGIVAGADGGQVANAIEWLNNLLSVVQRDASTTDRGNVLQATAVSDLNQTITNPPTQAEVQALSDKVDELLAAMRTAGQLGS